MRRGIAVVVTVLLQCLFVSCSSNPRVEGTDQARDGFTVTYVDGTSYPEIEFFLDVDRPEDVNRVEVTEDGVSLPTRVFGLDESGVNVVLAVDRSNSMRENDKFEGAVAAADRFLNVLRPQDRVALALFGGDVETTPLRNSAAPVRTTLRSTDLALGTPMFDAISASTDLLKDVGGRRLVLVLTDGLDNRSDESLAGVVEAAQREGVTVSAVGFGSGGSSNPQTGIDEPLLRELTSSTGGRYAYSETAAGVQALFETIAEDVTTEVRVEATSPRPLDGASREYSIALGAVAARGINLNPGGVVPQVAPSGARASVLFGSEPTAEVREFRVLFALLVVLLGLLAGALGGAEKWLAGYRDARLRSRYQFRYKRPDVKDVRWLCPREADEGFAFQVGELVVECPRCHSRHHKQCWDESEENGKCLNPVCGGVATSHVAGVVARRRRYILALGVMGALAGLLSSAVGADLALWLSDSVGLGVLRSSYPRVIEASLGACFGLALGVLLRTVEEVRYRGWGVGPALTAIQVSAVAAVAAAVTYVLADEVFVRSGGSTISRVLVWGLAGGALGGLLVGGRIERLRRGILGGVLGGVAGGLALEGLFDVRGSLVAGAVGLMVLGAAIGVGAFGAARRFERMTLEVVGGTKYGESLDLERFVGKAGGRVVLGSGSGKSHIRFDGLEAEHASIERQGDRIQISSIDGAELSVNFRPVENASLRDGSIIEVGPHELRFRERAQAPSVRVVKRER